MTQRQSIGKALGLFRPDPSWQRACSEVHKIVDSYIDRAITDAKLNNASGKTPFDEYREKSQFERGILHEFVKEERDRYFLRNQLLNVFLPARDSASIGISDVFFNLARHPDVWARLREELKRWQDRPMCFEVLKEMKYLQAVMRESMFLGNFDV